MLNGFYPMVVNVGSLNLAVVVLLFYKKISRPLMKYLLQKHVTAFLQSNDFYGILFSIYLCISPILETINRNTVRDMQFLFI